MKNMIYLMDMIIIESKCKMQQNKEEIIGEVQIIYDEMIRKINDNSTPVQFKVPGKPQGKARPRFSKRRGQTTCYTPEKTVNYEELVKLCYITQCNSHYFGDDTALQVKLGLWYPIAQRTPKKDKIAMLERIKRPTVKPDIDNVIKIICDSLNGLAYKDDAQIVEVVAYKYYSENPCVIVEISSVD